MEKTGYVSCTGNCLLSLELKVGVHVDMRFQRTQEHYAPFASMTCNTSSWALAGPALQISRSRLIISLCRHAAARNGTNPGLGNWNWQSMQQELLSIVCELESGCKNQ